MDNITEQGTPSAQQQTNEQDMYRNNNEFGDQKRPSTKTVEQIELELPRGPSQSVTNHQQAQIMDISRKFYRKNTDNQRSETLTGSIPTHDRSPTIDVRDPTSSQQNFYMDPTLQTRNSEKFFNIIKPKSKSQEANLGR